MEIEKEVKYLEVTVDKGIIGSICIKYVTKKARLIVARIVPGDGRLSKDREGY